MIGVQGLPSTTLEYRPAIDGLRGVAVLGVFLFHLKRGLLPGGFVGVDIFFVISGYLITSILVKDCARENFSFTRFYQRRIARLQAAFFVVALFTIAGAALFYTQRDLASTAASLAGASGFVANLKFMLEDNYFFASVDAQPFLHCWSLSVEEQFYMIFPALFLVLFRLFRKNLPQVLTVLCLISFLACVALTRSRPVWAFYLLPTRAWELLAGSIFATIKKPEPRRRWLPSSAPLAGIAIIAFVFAFFSESLPFPGYRAALPVLGTVLILIPYDLSGGVAERLLSWSPIVLVGRMSYSLYLWHWPVFSIVDYELFQASGMTRLVLKLVISATATWASYSFVENPARKFLNRPDNRRWAFGALAVSLLTLIPLGVVIRHFTYINASARVVANGGLQLNRSGKNGTIVLMGDSTGSMYGVMVKEVAKKLDVRLTVISADATDPLPRAAGDQPKLWNESLSVIERERPDVVILVCLWNSKLDKDRERLRVAVDAMKESSHQIILITQAPLLPVEVSRQGIRDGAHPPFYEDANERASRLDINNYLMSFQGNGVTVLNIEPLFANTGGDIRFTDAQGNQLFEGPKHISGYGAELVKNELIEAIRSSAH